MLFKISCIPKHPLYSDLPGLFRHAQITKSALSFNNLDFSVVRFNSTQLSGSFIPAATRLWNDLPSHVVESVQLQNFKFSVNTFLLSRHL